MDISLQLCIETPSCNEDLIIRCHFEVDVELERGSGGYGRSEQMRRSVDEGKGKVGDLWRELFCQLNLRFIDKEVALSGSTANIPCEIEGTGESAIDHIEFQHV